MIMNDKIAGFRRICGLTQAQMAEKLSISVTTYRNKESGKTKFTSEEMKIFTDLVKTIINVEMESIFF